MAPSACIEFERQFCGKLAPTPCDPGHSVLPPTRSYTADEVEKKLKYLKYLRRADAILVIVRVADQSDTRYFGTITDLSSSASATVSGSANFYRNAAFWSGVADDAASRASLLASEYSDYSYSRVAFGQFGLFDLESGNIAWLGKILVGSHSNNTTPEAFIDSATIEIARELKASKLVN
jgi:hypothetical protein